MWRTYRTIRLLIGFHFCPPPSLFSHLRKGVISCDLITWCTADKFSLLIGPWKVTWLATGRFFLLIGVSLITWRTAIGTVPPPHYFSLFSPFHLLSNHHTVNIVESFFCLWFWIMPGAHSKFDLFEQGSSSRGDFFFQFCFKSFSEKLSVSSNVLSL